MIHPGVWEHATAKAPERPRVEPTGAGCTSESRDVIPPARGLFGTLVRAVTRGLAAAIAGTTPPDPDPRACAICKRDRRQGFHVSAVFRLHGRDLGDGEDALLVFLAPDGRGRPLCLDDARQWLIEATRALPPKSLEVER